MVAYLKDGDWDWCVLLWVLVPTYALLGVMLLGATVAGIERSVILEVARNIAPILIGVTLLAVLGWHWLGGRHDHTK